MQSKLFAALGLAMAFGTINAAPSLNPREITPPPACTVKTLLVGDGNPHQNGLRKQVSEPITCAKTDGCSVSDLTSYTISYSVDGSVAQWIGAGFSVSESFTTGNSYTCNGGPGEVVCVWSNIAHTAYTVSDYSAGQCSQHGAGPDHVIKSPNKNNAGGGYYCVTGSGCGTNGQSYWDDSGA